MAMGHVLDIRWINEGKIYVGGYCTAQGTFIHAVTILNCLPCSRPLGTLQQIGETGSALATLVRSDISMYHYWDIALTVPQAIAVHTVIAVLWGKLSRNTPVAYCVVGITWLFVILFVAVGVSVNTHGSEHYETPDGVSVL